MSPRADVFRFSPDSRRKLDPSALPSRATNEHSQPFDHLVGSLLERRYLKLIKSVRLNVEALGFKGSFLAFALF